MADQTSLKKALMVLGNTLVTEYGFDPSFGQHKKMAETMKGDTTMIAAFVEWINQNPDAQVILEDMGFRWEM